MDAANIWKSLHEIQDKMQDIMTELVHVGDERQDAPEWVPGSVWKWKRGDEEGVIQLEGHLNHFRLLSGEVLGVHRPGASGLISWYGRPQYWGGWSKCCAPFTWLDFEEGDTIEGPDGARWEIGAVCSRCEDGSSTGVSRARYEVIIANSEGIAGGRRTAWLHNTYASKCKLVKRG